MMCVRVYCIVCVLYVCTKNDVSVTWKRDLLCARDLLTGRFAFDFPCVRPFFDACRV